MPKTTYKFIFTKKKQHQMTYCENCDKKTEFLILGTYTATGGKISACSECRVIYEEVVIPEFGITFFIRSLPNYSIKHTQIYVKLKKYLKR